MPIRIYADFNSQDERGRVWLDRAGSLPDLERYEDQLRPGLPVILYTEPEDYVEVEGVLIYDEEHGVWLAAWAGSDPARTDARA